MTLRALNVFLAFLFSFAMPGAGQVFNGQHRRGWIYAILMMLFGALTTLLLNARPPSSAFGFYFWLYTSGALQHSAILVRLLASLDAALRAYRHHVHLRPRLGDLRQVTRFMVCWGALYIAIFVYALPRLQLKTHGPGRDMVTHNVPGLLREIDAEDPVRREAACHMLGELGSSAREALPGLEKVVRTDVVSDVRLQAFQAMVQIDGNAPTTELAIKQALGDVDPRLQDLARQTLSTLSSRSALIQSLLKDPNSLRRKETVEALSLMDPSAETLRWLEMADQDSDAEVRKIAHQTLEYERLSEPLLLRRTQAPHYTERSLALTWIGRRKLTSRAALDALTRGLQDPDREVREAAQNALQALHQLPKKS